MALYDHELILISERIDVDNLGNQIPVEASKKVLCSVNSIGSNEFYNASVNGMKPEIEFIIHAYEYEGEQKVEYKGVTYSIIRTYKQSFEEIELTCQRNVGNE
ncbi:phage head closure protein [Aquibacillus kalidii]|uniref:phage head closure protein n=1 Tax=Aquibacillus kalidii TaxID=2762597 RepID=UPI0016455BEB|nr:phage head closure protein [Aquibacillus kalidii]